MSARRMVRGSSALALAAVLWPQGALAQPQPRAPDRAALFVLDYEVPESPAFVALGVSPANVLRAGAAKPVVANLLNQLLTGGTVDNGIAIDFSPYAVFGGGVRSVREYAGDRVRRLLFNTTLSLATIADEAADGDIRFGFGLRTTIVDSRDPLADTLLANTVSAMLAAAAVAPTAPPVDREVGDVVDLAERGVDLGAAYRAARERAARTPGPAVAVGWGFAGPVHGAVLAIDSIGDLQHRLWLAGRWAFSSGPDLQVTTQYVSRLGEVASSLRVGAALRASGADYSFALEAGWDSVEGFMPGISADARALPGVHLVAALVADRPTIGGPVRVTLRNTIRWNRSEGR